MLIQIDELAAGLLSLGLQKGDRIGVWGPNSYNWFLSHFAGMKAGLIVVSLRAHSLIFKLLLG
jgi:long-subunit acyl-CoA synthetase (AMP-forming)